MTSVGALQFCLYIFVICEVTLDTDYDTCICKIMSSIFCVVFLGERRGRDRIVVGFIATCAISAYHH